MSDLLLDIVRRLNAVERRLGQTEVKETLTDTVSTWTPALVGSTTPGTFTYDTGNTGGEYTQIGNRVQFNGRVRITAITVAPVGAVRITLPLTSANSSFVNAGGGSFGYWMGFTLPAGFTDVGFYIANAVAYLSVARSGSAIAAANMAGADVALVGGVFDVLFAGSYRV